MRALPDTYGSIYAAICLITGKVYVGQTTRGVARRLRGHGDAARTGSSLPFHRALRKYGQENFQFEVVEHCASLEDLNAAETRWIAELGAFGRGGYNCTTGGEGFEMGVATRKRMSEARIGKPTSKAHKDALRVAMRGSGNPFYGKKHKPETVSRMKAKLSVLFSGEGNPFFGRTHSEATRKHLSAANRGRPMHENTRAGIQKANLGNQYTKGRKLSISHKEKLSQLTVAGVQYIRRNPEGLSRPALAAKLGVTYTVVRCVQDGRTWKDVA